MAMLPGKLPRNTFKCFQCRALFNQREGTWIDWDTMQVHLCDPCERTTKDHEDRAVHRAAGKP